MIVWFNKVDPFYYGLIPAIVFGLILGAIIGNRFHADAIETSPMRCQDKVIALSISNTCPKGTFLEVQDDDTEKLYIVCHCEQPINVIIQMLPDQDQLPEDPEQDILKERPAPGHIAL